MKILATVLLICTSIIWGQQIPQQIQIFSPAPPSLNVNQMSGSIVGTPGGGVNYYWIIVNYPVGNAGLGGPLIVTRVPDTLSVSNYVRVNWSPMAGATSYDLLRTTTPVFPAGNCSCAVSTGITVTTYNNTSSTLSSYTLSTVGSAIATMSVDNLTGVRPFVSVNLANNSFNTNYRMALIDSTFTVAQCATIQTAYPGILFSQSCGSGSGTVTSAIIAGTSNQINVAGTCTITTTGTCTISLSTSILLPGNLTASNVSNIDFSNALSIALTNVFVRGDTSIITTSGVTWSISPSSTAPGIRFVPGAFTSMGVISGYVVFDNSSPSQPAFGDGNNLNAFTSVVCSGSTCTQPAAGYAKFAGSTFKLTTDAGPVIATGAKALATGAISSAACSAAQTDTATGAATTDVIAATFNADPTGVTGYVPLTAGGLTIYSYPTTNTVNFKVCNFTASSITPGAITLNWRVIRQ